jgi:predicted ribosome quality control (RQC) complex YloA/Tae2 family protein
MSLNWREIDLVLGELPLEGAHVQQVIQPDFRNVLFQVYQPGNPFWLLVCLETGRTRLHQWTGPVKKPKTRQRFAQMLHSRIRGGKIISAQHVNNDRIVRLDIVRAGEHSTLWIRLWGGAANIIATDETGVIVDAFFRRPKRGEISGGHFDVPEQAPDLGTGGNAAADRDRFESRFASGHGESGASVNLQIEDHYREIRDAEERDNLLASGARILRQQRNRLEQQLDRTKTRLAETEPADRMKLYGDLIMANLHRMKHGDRWLEAQDYTNDNSPITIELTPALSPGANAEHCYDRAKRSRRRQEALADEAKNLERRLADTQARLETIDDADLAELRTLVEHTAATAGAKSELGAPTPGLQFSSGEFMILIGRNAKENDQLLRRHVRGNDLWLHTRDYPGGYVFILTRKGKSVPLEVLLDAGNLAVHFSKAKSNGRAELYYAQVKHLRRVKGGPVGLVLPTHEKNLSVVVDQIRLDRMLK